MSNRKLITKQEIKYNLERGTAEYVKFLKLLDDLNFEGAAKFPNNYKMEN